MPDENQLALEESVDQLYQVYEMFKAKTQSIAEAVELTKAWCQYHSISDQVGTLLNGIQEIVGNVVNTGQEFQVASAKTFMQNLEELIRNNVIQIARVS